MPETLLKKIYLFRDMNTDQLSLVNECSSMKTYQPTDLVFSQGMEPDALYVIQYGSVKIYQETDSGDRVAIATLGTGSHFGEMSFLDGEDRSASVEVVEKSDILKIPYQGLKSILAEHPAMSIIFYRAMSIFLSGRLRQTTTDLKFSRELNLRHF